MAWVDLNQSRASRPKRIYIGHDPDAPPSPELIYKLIEEYARPARTHYQRLQRYYEGESDILLRRKTDPTKPNNKLVSGYPAYIVDVIQGYFMGVPVTYSSEVEGMLEDIQEILNYNDEQDENSELAKMAGIKGRGYEVVYIDQDSALRFNELDPDNIIFVHDTGINPEPNFAIVVDWGNEWTGQSTTATVYTRTSMQVYTSTSAGMQLVEEKSHFFSQLPVIEWPNNDELIGDFERVISLIDAYDKANSDTANDFEEFTDAFLYLVNLAGTEPEDIRKLKDDKVLLLDEAGQAGWLTKDINDNAIENYKNRLTSDIHKFAKVPDVSDESFAGNASGVAMKYKLLALNQIVATKQRKFKRALQRRVELICEFLALKGKRYDYRDLSIQFTVNQPINEREAVEMAVQMLGITSLSTALSKVPGVDDIEAELAKIEAEKSSYYDLDLLKDDANGVDDE